MKIPIMLSKKGEFIYINEEELEDLKISALGQKGMGFIKKISIKEDLK